MPGPDGITVKYDFCLLDFLNVPSPWDYCTMSYSSDDDFLNLDVEEDDNDN